jgi:hypothetical protein
MLQITRESDEIIVHEVPVAQWFYSIVAGLVLGGVFFVGISFLTKIPVLAICVGTLVFAGAALLYHRDNPSTTVKINKQGKIVSVRKKSLVGYKFEIYNFEELADLIYVDEIQVLPKRYQIILPLKNGKKIELSSQVKINEREYFDAADSLNSYIFGSSKQISAKAAAWNLKQKSD